MDLSGQSTLYFLQSNPFSTHKSKCQQVALTSGFMCIIACDCNGASLAPGQLAYFAESPEASLAVQDLVCSTVPWGEVDFADAAADVDMLAQMSAPLMEVCGCASQ